jgi:RNA polymerase sigma factor (sigma-70 family)
MSALGVPQAQLARTEADLVGAVRSGDERAFGELYSRYERSILAYVDGILGDHGRAEDVVQDVFVSALRAMRASDRAIAFKPWIYEIARNACIDEVRRRQRSREVSADGDEAVADRRDLAAPAPAPEIFMERRQQLNDLRGAFGGLSDSQHKVLVLREFEGRSYTQIAEKTGMSLPMVESTLFRARRRLGQEYDEIASGRRCAQVLGVIETGGEEAFRALGLRERRRFTRHVSHCQPCRRHAHLAGIDESALRVPSLAERLAGLLPLPLVPWRRIFAAGRVSRTARSLHRLAPFSDPGSAAGAGQAAVVVAAMAMAVGGGVADLKAPASHVSGASVVRASDVHTTHSQLSAGSQGAVTSPVGAPARTAHRSAQPANAYRSTSTSSSRSTSHTRPSSSSLTNSPLGSSPTSAVPSAPSQPSLPSLHHVVKSTLKSTKTSLSSLLHRTTSTTKHLLRPLPIPIGGPVRADR